VDEKLRPGIEQALLSTLDPETAQKAMEAMIPYFEKPNAPPQARAGQQYHGSRANRKRTIRMLPHIPSALSPSPTVISARERSLQTSSPLSVRSSQSEPIRYSKAPSKAADRKPGLEFTDSVHSDYTELPEIKQVPPYTQPAYNSPAMLHLLRAERQSRARNQIAALTGWKVNRTPSNDTDSATDQRRKVPKETEHDAKLEHVNNMKQLYMSGGAGADTDKGTGVHLPAIRAAKETSLSKLTPSNLAEHNKSFNKPKIVADNNARAVQPSQQKSAPMEQEDGEVVPGTPRVGDIDLDDAAFSLISKYFQSSTGVTSTAGGAGMDTPESAILSPSQKRLLYDVRHHGTDTQGHGASMSIPATPYKGIGYDDVSHTEEYMGGMDGLLAWTSQLELDLI